MTDGLSTTWRTLAKTPNEAAVAVLAHALDAPSPAVRQEALRALLERRSPGGHQAILARLDKLEEAERAILFKHRSRMLSTLRDSLVSHDETLFRNACQAILWFREYDLAPVLIKVAEEKGHPCRKVAAATARTLAESLYVELASPRDYDQQRRDPQLVRNHVTAAFEASTPRHRQHKCVDLVEAFLLLAHRDNATLKQILHDPLHENHRVVIDRLTHCEHPGVMRLVLGWLDDPGAPGGALVVLAHRRDPRFIRHLLNKIGREPSAAAAQNLRRIETIPWLQSDLGLLDEFDDAAQHGAVQLAEHSSIAYAHKFAVVEYLLLHGKPGGRRGAAAALQQFSGLEANRLALIALKDADPQVQAVVCRQLRQRGIPGAISRLLEQANNPHAAVRQAVRESLSEFSFAQYLGAFDMLDDEQRKNTGAIVRKLTPDCAAQLRGELESPSRTRRLRGLAMTRSLRAASDVQTCLIEMLGEPDHLLRCEAIVTLGEVDSPAVERALRESLADASAAVQEAAEASLERLMDRRRTATETAAIGAKESL